MYMFEAMIWCEDCLSRKFQLHGEPLDEYIEDTLRAHDIDPAEEWQWDSDDFPKSVPPFYSGLRTDCH